MSLPATNLCRQLLSLSCRSCLPASRLMSSISYDYQAINVSVPSPFVFNVEMNRPAKMNAMNKEMWTEIGEVFNKLDQDPNCRWWSSVLLVRCSVLVWTCLT